MFHLLLSFVIVNLTLTMINNFYQFTDCIYSNSFFQIVHMYVVLSIFIHQLSVAK